MVPVPLLPLLALAAALVAPARALLPPPAPRLTVVTDPALALDAYSLFWASLSDRGYALTFRTTADQAPLSDPAAGTRSFDHLLLFAPTTKSFPPDLSPQALVASLASPSSSTAAAPANLFVILSPSLTEHWRDLAREFDLDFDDRATFAIDHFSFSPTADADGTHTALALDPASLPEPFVSPATRRGPPVLYRGIAHATTRNPLLTPVLRANPTAYSFELGARDVPTEDLFLAGRSMALVSAFQARNNARVVWAGSADLFSDAFIQSDVLKDGVAYPTSGNLGFITDLTKWAFHESGVLALSPPDLRRTSDGSQSSLYRVKESLDLSASISTLRDGRWHPFQPDALQFEFTMLDPHLRLPLLPALTQPPVPEAEAEANATLLATTFTVPDRHGVFTLRVDYRRPGYTAVQQSQVVTVTPFRHDEYERWIKGAVPWYLGAGSVVVATLGFVAVWLTL